LATFLHEDEEEERRKEEHLKTCAMDHLKRHHIGPTPANNLADGEFEAGDYGQLLINIDDKFMLFDCTCEFINKVDFYAADKPERGAKESGT
jgi:hypothetical protein